MQSLAHQYHLRSFKHHFRVDRVFLCRPETVFCNGHVLALYGVAWQLAHQALTTEHGPTSTTLKAHHLAIFIDHLEI